jgi:uncharacterized membrane protein
MPKAKQRKNHKQKVKARNERISQDKRKYEKAQREMLMKLIEQEKQNGMFNNLPQINPEITLDGTQIEGPTI